MTTRAKPLVIDTLDLTLDQLDEAEALVSAGEAGRMVATAYVAMKASGAPISLDAAKKLTFRDVTIREGADAGDDPTPAP